jgi:hypothetical protein
VPHTRVKISLADLGRDPVEDALPVEVGRQRVLVEDDLLEEQPLVHIPTGRPQARHILRGQILME